MNDTIEMIQRLVDGELDANARKSLLLELDGHSPECWRDLALGLLEARLISEALRSSCDTSSMVTERTRPGVNNRWALAAMLALGLGLGILLPTSAPDRKGENEVLAAARRKPAPLKNLEITTTGENSLSIPVLNTSGEPSEGYKLLQAASEPMRRVSQAFTEKGPRTELSTAYISTGFENGTQLVLPVSYLSIPHDTAKDNQLDH